MNDLLKVQALGYANMGLSVFPVAGKKPTIKWQARQSSAMPEAAILHYFAKPFVTGVAVVLGAVSGDLACRDFDLAESYHAWKSHFPKEAAQLPTAKTPRGYHAYFRCAGVKTIHLGDGELRGSGGYVVLPSSIVDGTTYCWLKPFGGDILSLNPDNAGLAQPWDRMNREDRADRETEAVNKKERETEFCPNSAIRSLEQAVALAVPSGPGENHRLLFLMSRALLACQKYRGIALTETELTEAFGRWHKAALAYLQPSQSYDEYLMEFLEAWNRVRFPLGDREIIRAAWQAASASQPRAIGKLSDPRLILLASFCRELQRLVGDAPFFLACRTVQELFKLDSHVSAHNWLVGLVRFKILGIVKRGTQGKTGKATRYRYLLPLD